MSSSGASRGPIKERSDREGSGEGKGLKKSKNFFEGDVLGPFLSLPLLIIKCAMQDDYFTRFLESRYDSGSNSVRIDDAEKVVADLDDLFHQKVELERKMMNRIVYVERFQLYLQDGYESTGEWFANRYGIGYGRAEEFVWVALCLEDFPKLEEAYREGFLSYDHVRACRGS